MTPATDRKAEMHSPFGRFALHRYPPDPDPSLLAWCSADSLLLEEVWNRQVPGDTVLAVNDAYGALSVALAPKALWTDSKLALLALRNNERANSSPSPTPVIWSTQPPPSTPAVVVMRIPKQRAFFEYQLRELAHVMPEGTTLLAAGMDKHLSPNAAQFLEQFIGPTQRHPGRRKARLFVALRDARSSPPEAGRVSYHCDALNAGLCSLPNVFSREKLDIGTRFLLEHMHRIPPAGHVVDLACGNGVVGLVAYKQGLAQTVAFCDESAMAVASAQLNATTIFAESTQAFRFYHGDGLLEYSGGPASLILCNPPFHQEHTVNELAGQHLLGQCGHYLSSGGHLCLVANRHLDYRPVLSRDFHQTETIAENARFKVLLTRKR